MPPDHGLRSFMPWPIARTCSGFVLAYFLLFGGGCSGGRLPAELKLLERMPEDSALKVVIPAPEEGLAALARLAENPATPDLEKQLSTLLLNAGAKPETTLEQALMAEMAEWGIDGSRPVGLVPEFGRAFEIIAYIPIDSAEKFIANLPQVPAPELLEAEVNGLKLEGGQIPGHKLAWLIIDDYVLMTNSVERAKGAAVAFGNPHPVSLGKRERELADAADVVMLFNGDAAALNADLAKLEFFDYFLDSFSSLTAFASLDDSQEGEHLRLVARKRQQDEQVSPPLQLLSIAGPDAAATLALKNPASLGTLVQALSQYYRTPLPPEAVQIQKVLTGMLGDEVALTLDIGPAGLPRPKLAARLTQPDALEMLLTLGGLSNRDVTTNQGVPCKVIERLPIGSVYYALSDDLLMASTSETGVREILDSIHGLPSPDPKVIPNRAALRVDLRSLAISPLLQLASMFGGPPMPNGLLEVLSRQKPLELRLWDHSEFLEAEATGLMPTSLMIFTPIGMARDTRPANESMAIGNLRTIVGAQVAFHATNYKYASSFDELTESTPSFLDGDWVSTRGGYDFKVLKGAANTFKVVAVPADQGASGFKSFFVDQSGVIRFSDQGVADASSPTIGEMTRNATPQWQSPATGKGPPLPAGVIDAKRSVLKADIAVLRNAITLYFHQHGNTYPDAEIVAQLTKRSDAEGNLSDTRSDAFPFGPYLTKIPQNPFAPPGIAADEIAVVQSSAPLAPDAALSAGWKYSAATGEFIANMGPPDDTNVRPTSTTQSPLVSRPGGIGAGGNLRRLAGALEEGNIAAAQAQIKQFETAIVGYKIKFKRLPAQLSDLTSPPKGDPLMESIPNDPWGNPYQYLVEGSSRYNITSYGGDGSPGGTEVDADISMANMREQEVPIQSGVSELDFDVSMHKTAEERSSQNNLKQLGIIFKMHSNESEGEFYPTLSPTPGRLMFDPHQVYPQYMNDPRVLINPGANDAEDWKRRSSASPASVIDDQHYVYLGFALENETQAEALAAAYLSAMQHGTPLSNVLDTSTGKLHRLREGVERFFIKDISNPAASFDAQAGLPIVVERPGVWTDGSVNVLYMDGHVERVQQGAFPNTFRFWAAVETMDHADARPVQDHTSAAAEIPSHAPNASLAEIGAEYPPVRWDGTWKNAEGASNTFILYLNTNASGMARAVGAAENWTAWEVFQGRLADGQWRLEGEKVVQNKRPADSYVLDTLFLEEGEGGKTLEGRWQDRKNNRGVVTLDRHVAMGSDCPFTAELDLDEVSSGPTAASKLANAQLTLRRLGPIEFGMTIQEVEQALGEPLNGDKEKYGSPDCYMAAPQSMPNGLEFMIEKGRVVRVDITTPSITTKSGAKVGDSEASIMSLYGDRIKVQPHKYAQNGKYLTYVPVDAGDKNFRLIFDVVDGAVTLIRAGELPAVAYVEHCL